MRFLGTHKAVYKVCPHLTLQVSSTLIQVFGRIQFLEATGWRSWAPGSCPSPHDGAQNGWVFSRANGNVSVSKRGSVCP